MLLRNTSSFVNSPDLVPSSVNCRKYSLSDHTEVVYALVAINIVTSVLGTLGNTLVCIAVFTTKRMTSSFHYFIASLAAADLTVAFVDQPLLIALIIGRMHSGECLADLEAIFRAVGNFACAVSLLTLALIALDRCLFVTRMYKYKNTMTTGKKIVLVVVWLLAIVYTSIRLTIDKKITSYLTAAIFGICYIEMIVCYGLTYRLVGKQRQLLTATGNQQSEPGDEELDYSRARANDNRTERGFTRTILMVLAVFTCAWGLIFYLRLTQPDKDYGVMYNVARTVAFSSSALNPALYCFNNKEYRTAFKKITIKICAFRDPGNRKRQYEIIK